MANAIANVSTDAGANLPGTESDLNPFAKGAGYKPCAVVVFDDGLTPIKTKTELRRIERDEAGNFVRDEKGELATGDKWPEQFDSADVFFDAIEELMSVGTFDLRTSWDAEVPVSSITNPVQWSFRAGKDGANPLIFASIVPTVDDVASDESLARLIIPQGIRANIGTLHAMLASIMSNAVKMEKYRGTLQSLDTSPAAILRAAMKLGESQAGIKQRQAMSVALWNGVVAQFKAKLDSANMPAASRVSFDAFVGELAMYGQNPENMLRVISSHDGVVKILEGSRAPAPVIKAVSDAVAANLKALATIPADDKGYVVYARGRTETAKPKLIKQSVVKRILDARPQTSYATAALDLSGDDALMALFTEAAAAPAAIPSQAPASAAPAGDDKAPAGDSAGSAPDA